jgi:hypothetical protein
MIDAILSALGFDKKESQGNKIGQFNSSLSRTKFEYFKEAHEFEIERRETLNSRISLLTTSLAAGAGFVAYYLHGPLPTDWRTLSVIYSGVCFAGVYSLLMAAWQGWKVIEERNYAYPPAATEIRTFLQKLEDYNNQVPLNDRQDVEQQMLLELTDKYCQCTQVNADHNETRGRRFRAAILWSFFAIILFTSALPFFTVISMLQSAPTSVRIVNPIEIK